MFYTYHGDHTARPDTTAHSHHAHVVRVLAPPQEVLVAHEVGAVIDHETASLHPAGLTPAQEGGHVGAVTVALIGTTLEVPLLVEDDLRQRQKSCCLYYIYENNHWSQLYSITSTLQASLK